MSTLIRFIEDGKNLAVILVKQDCSNDILSWLNSHRFGGIYHICCLYRLYCRYKYGKDMILYDKTHKHEVICYKYDIFESKDKIICKVDDYITDTYGQFCIKI